MKYCDRLAAFVEAGLSISYGVKSKDLVRGFQNIRAKFKKSPKIEGVDFDKICRGSAIVLVENSPQKNI